MEHRRKLAVLGSTGSIGRQTLDIAAEYPGLFEVEVLVANRSAELLIEQARRHKPSHVVIASEDLYPQVAQALSGTGIEVHTGSDIVSELVALPQVDTVVTAMVGYSGLASTIAASKAGKKIALANKETLVVAGELINRMLESSASVIYPVDSEHGAFYQCLVGEDMNNVSKLILTASGGPFRTMSKEQLATVTKADALRHPNWSMGAKITIDSATMMNKGFEMIEAKWLYGISQERIEIVVHPQSIVHDYANLTFEKPDFDKFPLLTTAYDAARRGGNAPCVMNAANEIAVAAFLHDKIGFNDIFNIIERTMTWAPFIAKPGYDDYVATNAQSRAYAESLI